MVGYSHTKCGKWKVQVNRHAQTQNMWHWHHPGGHWHRGWYPNVIGTPPKTNKESNIDFLQILFVRSLSLCFPLCGQYAGWDVSCSCWLNWLSQRGGLISLVEQGDFAARTWEVRETWSSTRDLPSVRMKWDESSGRLGTPRELLWILSCADLFSSFDWMDICWLAAEIALL